MKVSKIINICVPFIGSLIKWIDSNLARLGGSHYYLQCTRKEFMALIAAMLDSHEKFKCEEVENIRTLIEMSYKPCVDKNQPTAHDESDSSDSVDEFSCVVRNPETGIESVNGVQEKQGESSQNDQRNPELTDHDSDYCRMHYASIGRVSNYLIDCLQSLVETPRESDSEESEMDERTYQPLEESGTTNNADAPKRTNDKEVPNEEMRPHSRALNSTKSKKAKPPEAEPESSSQGLESTTWPRVLMHKIDINSLKYARKISETRLMFAHKHGHDRAFRSSENRKNDETASTSRAGTSKKSMTLRSDSNKKVDESKKAKNRSSKTSRKNDKNTKGRNESETPRSRSKRQRSSGKSRKKRNNRKLERSRGPKSANDAPETETNNPDDSSTEDEEYHKFKKRRRLMSHSDQNRPRSAQETSNSCENVAQRTRSNKKARNSERAQKPKKAQKPDSSSHSMVMGESEDSFGGTTEEDTETISDEEPRNVVSVRDDDSRNQCRNDDNSNSGYDASTDDGSISVLSVRDDSRDQYRNDDGSNAVYDMPTDEEPSSVLSVRDDSRDQCGNDDGSNAVYDMPTDEEPSSVLRARDDETRDQYRNDDRSNAIYDVQTDEEPTSVDTVREYRPRDQCRNYDNSSAVFDVQTDEEPPNVPNLEEEESQEHHLRIENVVSLQNVQTNGYYQPEANVEGEEYQPSRKVSVIIGNDAQNYENLQITITVTPDEPQEYRAGTADVINENNGHYVLVPTAVLYGSNVRVQVPVVTDNNVIAECCIDPYACQIPLTVNNEERPQYPAGGENMTYGVNLYTNEEYPHVPSYTEQPGQYYDMNTQDYNYPERPGVIYAPETEFGKNNVVAEDVRMNEETSGERPGEGINYDNTLEEDEENSGARPEEGMNYGNTLEEDEENSGERPGEGMNYDNTLEEDEENSGERPGEGMTYVNNVKEDEEYENEQADDGQANNEETDDDDDDQSVVCVNEEFDETNRQSYLMFGVDKREVTLDFLVRKYNPEFSEEELEELKRDIIDKIQSYCAHKQPYTTDDNAKTKVEGGGNNPVVDCTEDDDKGRHVSESPQKKQSRGPIEENPIECIDISNDEREDNIFLIEPKEDECQKPLIPDDKDDSEVDTNVGFKIGEPRSLVNTVIDNESEEDCDASSERPPDVQKSPEAEQIEANLADSGQIVARDGQSQQPTAGQTNSDQSVTPSVVDTTEPQDARQIWRTGPLEAQLSENAKALFECNVEDCPFATRLYYLFEDHIKNNHTSELWRGDCERCEGEVPGEEPLTIRAALKHLTNHVRQTEGTHSAGMLESGDENVDGLEAYQNEVTAELERFQKEINDRRNSPLKQIQSTSNNPNESAAQEENSSTNREEQEGTSSSNEECVNSDDNLMCRVQDVENANFKVVGCEINCNEVGLAMKSQSHESSIHAQIPVRDSSSSPPVLTPMLPLESRTPERDNTESVLTPSTSKTFESQNHGKGGTDSSQSVECTILVTDITNSVSISKTSKNSNSKRSAEASNLKGGSKSQVFESSKSSGSKTLHRNSIDFEPLPSTSRAAMSSSYSEFASPQPSTSNTIVREGIDSVSVPSTSRKSSSKLPAKGKCKSLAYRLSQLSRLNNAVRDSTDFEPLPSTSSAATSSSRSELRSPQPSGSHTLVRNSYDFEPLPSTSRAAMSSSYSEFASPQPSTSNTIVRESTDSVSVPSTSRKSSSKLPAKGKCKSLAYRLSQSSRLNNVVRDSTDFEPLPSTSSAATSSSRSELRSPQPSGSHTLVRNSFDFEPVPSTSRAAMSSSYSEFGSPQPSTSYSIVRESTDSVSVPSTSKKSSSKLPAKGKCKSLAYRLSQSSGLRTAIRDITEVAAIASTSKAPESQAPLTTSLSSPPESVSSQPSGSSTLMANSNDFEPFLSTSSAATSNLNNPSGFGSPQSSTSNTIVKESANSVSVPSTSRKSSSKLPAKGKCKSLAYRLSQSSRLNNAVRDSTDFEPVPSSSSAATSSSRSEFGSPQTPGSDTSVRNSTDSVPTSKTSDLQTPDNSSPFVLQFSQLCGYQTPVWSNFDAIPTTSRTFESQALAKSPPFVLEFSQQPASQTPVRNSINSVSIPTTSNSQISAMGGSRFRLVFESSQPSEPQTTELSSQQDAVLSSFPTPSSSDNGSLTPPTRSAYAVIDISDDEERPVTPQGVELLKLKQQFQWHQISGDGVRPNPKSLKAIRESSPPSNYSQLKRFLRSVRYCRRFIKNFSELSSPLIKLSRQNEFTWNDAEQKSFDELKRIFMAEPILHFPDFNEEFILTFECSFSSLCSVLSQGEIDNGRVIAYASRKLLPHEEKFSSTEKELVGIVWAVRYFKPYLQKRSFKIITTHEPLTWLIHCEDLGRRMAKLRRELLQYQFKLIYCDKNGGSEPLSPFTQSVSQSVDTSGGSDPYEKFIKFHYTAKDIPKVSIQVTTQTSHTPLVLFYSKDLSNYNPLSHYIRSNFNFDMVKEPSNLYDVVELKNSEQTIYLCICRHFHFERLRYEDIFCSLRSLRNILHKNEYSGKIFVLDVTSKYKHIQKDMLSEIMVYSFRNSNVEPILLTLKRITPTYPEIRKILEETHRGRSNAHYGFRNTYAKIKEKYKWTTMKYDVFNYVKHCRTCQESETNNAVNKTTNFGFNRLVANILGPLPQSKNGNKYILTVQDMFTKYLYGVAVPNCDLQTVSQEYWKLCRQMTGFGAPRVIFSGQGTHSNDRVINEGVQNADGEQGRSDPIANLLANPPLPLHHSLLSHLSGSSKLNEWDAGLPLLVLTDSDGYTPLEKLLLKTVLSRQTTEDIITID